jgi:hypothetical protein
MMEADENIYGDRRALALMASGPHLPDPDASRPRAVDAASRAPASTHCPTCGQAIPELVNQFATGSGGHRSLQAPVRVENIDAAPDTSQFTNVARG